MNAVYVGQGVDLRLEVQVLFGGVGLRAFVTFYLFGKQVSGYRVRRNILPGLLS